VFEPEYVSIIVRESEKLSVHVAVSVLGNPSVLVSENVFVNGAEFVNALEGVSDGVSVPPNTNFGKIARSQAWIVSMSPFIAGDTVQPPIAVQSAEEKN